MCPVRGLLRTSAVLALSLFVGCADPESDPCRGTPSAESTYPVSIYSWAKSSYFCAIHSGGGVKCWGDNFGGQLGADLSGRVWVPAVVKGLACVEEVAPAIYTTCARIADGTVRCVGDDDFGLLGNGSLRATGYPTTVLNLHDATALAGDEVGFAVLRSAGDVWAWGQADVNAESDRPRAVEGMSGPFLDIAAELTAICGTRADGGLDCVCDELLAAQIGRLWCIPELDQLRIVGRLHFGSGFACAISVDGRVYCFGDNDYGELGDGTQITREAPAPVPGLTEVQSVAVGRVHGCAVDGAGAVYCWGRGPCVGAGPNAADPQLTPMLVPLPSPAIEVAASQTTSCALLESHEVWCWGSGYVGELGVLGPPDYPGGPRGGTPCRPEPMPVEW